MAELLLFGPARIAAGVHRIDVDAKTVGEVIDLAQGRFGGSFAKVVSCSSLWLNGNPTTRDAPVIGTDEVAVLPPVSGG